MNYSYSFISAICICISSHLFAPQIQASEPVHYTLDSHRSDLRILVYKHGPLQFMGHNHVIRATKIDADIVKQKNKLTLTARLKLNDLEVDNPADRKRSGKAFENEIDNESALATRKNMLGKKLLHIERFPFIHAEASLNLNAKKTVAHLTLGIKQHSKQFRVPVLVRLKENGISVKGEWAFRQSDFGLTPFTIMGGLLSVQDEIRIAFTLHAEKRARTPSMAIQ